MEQITFLPGGITSANGFYASGVEAGVKYANRRDVALIWSDRPCVAAGVFTTNLVAAAPVVMDRERLSKTPSARAIAINTGCANACTGEQGLADARRIAAATADCLKLAADEVLVSSTGVIGTLLPVERIIAGVQKAKDALDRGTAADEAAGMAIMTTDTVPKRAAVQLQIDGKTVTLGGMCKGAGMIEPMMATMLAYVTTDAAVDPVWLQQELKAAADVSFNRVVVDGDESTNDTLICLANGAAGNAVLNAEHPAAAAFSAALKAVCTALAKQIVMDGEGVSKFVTVKVTGAQSDADAHLVARAIARSPLVKTSWFGLDPNWGRVICATGYSGAEVDALKVRIFYGDICAYDRGTVATEEALAAMQELMRARSFDVLVDLGLGEGTDTIYTCDLTFDYVKINAEYTT
ncbi:MAG: bifunctional glutamate N-acetyltransferase/amino-acid acetyltransferase ArgJ [Kiritimatiellae bacterium]|nr:bifunctional glutamate N-acetyltransferase/amino-acid acetyltransferase ArgJ [Kiritimatiellia bacterium]